MKIEEVMKQNRKETAIEIGGALLLGPLWFLGKGLISSVKSIKHNVCYNQELKRVNDRRKIMNEHMKEQGIDCNIDPDINFDENGFPSSITVDINCDLPEENEDDDK